MRALTSIGSVDAHITSASSGWRTVRATRKWRGPPLTRQTFGRTGLGGMLLERVLGFAAFEAAAVVGWFIAPAYGRWVVTLPAPRFVTQAPPESWTLWCRTGAVVIAAAGFLGLENGWIVTVGIAIAAWGITAWRYRTPRP